MKPDLHLVQGRIVPRQQAPKIPLLCILVSVALLCFPPVIGNSVEDHGRLAPKSSSFRFIGLPSVQMYYGHTQRFTVEWSRLLLLLAISNLVAVAIIRRAAPVSRLFRAVDFSHPVTLSFSVGLPGLAVVWFATAAYYKALPPDPPRASAPAKLAAEPYTPNPPPQKPSTFATAPAPEPFDPDEFLRNYPATKSPKK